MPRFYEKQPVQTRLAAHGQTGGRKKLALPPLTSPANPEDHVFSPFEDYGAKIEKLFQGQKFVFIRGGVGVGKSTLGQHLGREHPERFVSVYFGAILGARTSLKALRLQLQRRWIRVSHSLRTHCDWQKKAIEC